MAHPRTMDLTGEMEIMEGETIGICDMGSITMIEDSVTEANIIKEILQMSDIMQLSRLLQVTLSCCNDQCKDFTMLIRVNVLDFVATPLYCKDNYALNLKLDLTLLDTGDLILLSSLPKPWKLVCVLDNRPFSLEYSKILT